MSNTELELVRLAQAGDRRAAGKLILMHTGFIYKVINKINITGFSRDDLFQVATIGFLENLKTFNPEAGYKLLTWCVHGIRKQLYYVLQSSVRQKRSATMVSLDAAAAIDSNTPLVEMLESPACTNEHTLLQDAATAVSAIPNKKHRMYCEALLQTFTSDEETPLRVIGDTFGKSRERMRQVRQIIKKYPSMKRLREQLAA